MLRKDYILAQIEMLSGLIARILQLRHDGDERKVTDEIESTYHDLFGLDPRLISLLPNEFLLDKVRSGEYLDSEQGFTLAILLREDATNHLELGNELEHYQRLLRSLQVFLALASEHQLKPEQIDLYDMESVLNQMADYNLPPDIVFELFHFYEDTGRFACAEDMLHELINASEDKHEIVLEGVAYYEWLLTLTDDELIAGNLPRSEVEEGLQHLRAFSA